MTYVVDDTERDKVTVTIDGKDYHRTSAVSASGARYRPMKGQHLASALIGESRMVGFGGNRQILKAAIRMTSSCPM